MRPRARGILNWLGFVSLSNKMRSSYESDNFISNGVLTPFTSYQIANLFLVTWVQEVLPTTMDSQFKYYRHPSRLHETNWQNGKCIDLSQPPLYQPSSFNFVGLIGVCDRHRHSLDSVLRLIRLWTTVSEATYCTNSDGPLSVKSEEANRDRTFSP